MKTNIFTTAVALSDPDLLARTSVLAGDERESTAELVAHLAALEMRPAAHAALGHGTLFAYCTQALRLSEDAACTRIAAARWCRLFPVLADLMASGSLSLTTVRLVGPHLTVENHQAVLARATNKSRKDIEALVAELAPRPDLVASVRKLPNPKAANGTATCPSSMPPTTPATLWTVVSDGGGPSATDTGPSATDTAPSATDTAPSATGTGVTSAPSTEAFGASTPVAIRCGRRPVIKASAPDRYSVQFTIGPEAHAKLRRLQALLRREIPDGDPGLIFERFLDVLLEKVEKAKLGAARRRPRRVIRPETDKACQMHERPRSRHIPAQVKHAVWQRDRGQCAFVSHTNHRCTERSYLEFHHVQPYAMSGASSVANIALRCRRHNQYEAELIFGPRSRSSPGEGPHDDGSSNEPRPAV